MRSGKVCWVGTIWILTFVGTYSGCLSAANSSTTDLFSCWATFSEADRVINYLTAKQSITAERRPSIRPIWSSARKRAGVVSVWTGEFWGVCEDSLWVITLAGDQMKHRSVITLKESCGSGIITAGGLRGESASSPESWENPAGLLDENSTAVGRGRKRAAGHYKSVTSYNVLFIFPFDTQQ